MKTIKAKVHRLFTEDASQVVRRKDDGLLNSLGRPTKTSLDEWTNQHLYITTDEAGRTGDWVLGELGNAWQLAKGNFELEKWRKIIATTDPKLLTCQLDGTKHSVHECRKLAKIPQSFIEKYCKAGGIDEVLVEVEDIIASIHHVHPTNPTKSIARQPIAYGSRLKLNPDNTIIIHHVEEDKILKVLQKFWNSAVIECSVEFDDLPKWIEENL